MLGEREVGDAVFNYGFLERLRRVG
jgi:hypothetical protein